MKTETCEKCGKEFEVDDTFDFLFAEPVKEDYPLCPECWDKKLDEAQPKQKIIVDESSLLKEITLDCEGFEDIARKQNAVIDSKIVIDDIYIYEYTNAKGNKGWAIETGGQYASDAFYTNIKLYGNPVKVIDIR